MPKLAEIFDVTVDELMQTKKEAKENVTGNKVSEIVALVLKAIPLAMGIAVVVLSVMKELETNTAIMMLGLGLACMAVTQLPKKED